jgi:FdhD protein
LGRTRDSLVLKPRQFKTTRYERGESQDRSDSVPAESALDIYLCGTRIVTLQSTPSEQVELAVGFLLSEGLLSDPSEYGSSSLDTESRVVKVEARDRSAVLSRLLDRGEVIRTSGCGRGTSFGGYDEIAGVNSGLRVSSASITRLMGAMLKGAHLHKTCGGVHCSALAREGQILFVCEDIGRHNTIDKIIGKSVLAEIGLSDCLAVTTGRVSSEMVAKCARLSIPVVASLSCPTDMAVEMGERFGVTIVGYVRGKRMTVYTHGERVTG